MDTNTFHEGQLPILYHKDKNGKVHSWEICTIKSDIITRHGMLDGKKQISRKAATPKNIDKKNATTAEQQAISEAKSMWQYKRDRKYAESPKDAKVPTMLPMLAQDFEKRKKKNVVYPGYIQPKLDGVRCIARWGDDEIVLISRNGKPYNCPHIVKELKSILKADTVLDGELYVHGVGFQTITSWVKKLQPDTSKIEYHVYDMPIINDVDNYTFGERLTYLNSLKQVLDKHYKSIKVVPTFEVKNEKDVYSCQEKFVSDGYEGAIFRNALGLYLHDYRSYDLLKVKTFDEEDFEVVGFTEGIGKDKETVIWICKAENGEIFNVRPKTTYEERKEFFKNANKYVGLKLSVKYFGLSDEGIPRFPVGLGFKEDR